MLVLSRKPSESIAIGDGVRIVIVGIRDNKVRLGIEAPKEIAIHRGEVVDAIRRQGRLDAEFEREQRRLERLESVASEVSFNAMLETVAGPELSEAEADYIARGAARALMSSLHGPRASKR